MAFKAHRTVAHYFPNGVAKEFKLPQGARELSLQMPSHSSGQGTYQLGNGYKLHFLPDTVGSSLMLYKDKVWVKSFQLPVDTNVKVYQVDIDADTDQDLLIVGANTLFELRNDEKEPALKVSSPWERASCYWDKKGWGGIDYVSTGVPSEDTSTNRDLYNRGCYDSELAKKIAEDKGLPARERIDYALQIKDVTGERDVTRSDPILYDIAMNEEYAFEDRLRAALEITEFDSLRGKRHVLLFLAQNTKLKGEERFEAAKKLSEFESKERLGTLYKDAFRSIALDKTIDRDLRLRSVGSDNSLLLAIDPQYFEKIDDQLKAGERASLEATKEANRRGYPGPDQALKISGLLGKRLIDNKISEAEPFNFRDVLVYDTGYGLLIEIVMNTSEEVGALEAKLREWLPEAIQNLIRRNPPKTYHGFQFSRLDRAYLDSVTVDASGLTTVTVQLSKSSP